MLDPSCGISFNVSQAGELTVVAVTRDRDVGVDIERVRPLDEALDIARAWFSAQDVAVLLAMPRARRSLAFLSLWTRKEALTKALGGGLSIPLDSFDGVANDRHAGGRLYRSHGGQLLAASELETPAGYVGAVAVCGAQVRVRNMGSVVAER